MKYGSPASRYFGENISIPYINIYYILMDPEINVWTDGVFRKKKKK